MTLKLTKKFPNNLDLIILPVFEEQDLALILKVYLQQADLINLVKQDYKNKLGATYLIYPESQTSKRILLVGLGKQANISPGNFRKAIQTSFIAAQNFAPVSMGLVLPNLKKRETLNYIELIGFAAIFGTYKFTHYKLPEKQEKGKQLDQIYILSKINTIKAQKTLQDGVNIGLAANTARDLANHPGNIATPNHLAKHAVSLGKKFKFKVKVLGKAEIKKEGLGLLQAVSLGSDEEPKFIILEYLPSKKKNSSKSQPIALIGKGLTFDSGGLSIKPSEKMDEMKYDMCGGATVLGIFEAVAALKLPIHLVGLIPASENLVSGKAVKPGDVIKSHSGKTVEIINTDAEGRLILADAISYTKKYYDPKLMIDYATLTGAVLIALGLDYTGYFRNNNQFDKYVKQASRQSGELYWQLPLAPEYKDQLKSQIADIKNLAENSYAGSATAALFLESFVGNTPWIHMDIAGTAWSTRPKPYLPVGASAWGVYLTLNFLRHLK
jgi:leucyl aminopeptidase